MDNIKFAIDYLKNNSYKMVEENDNYAVQTSNMAIEALEKQKSIKPLNQRYINKELIGECPSCRLQWDVAFYQRYCSNCGQKLDWS